MTQRRKRQVKPIPLTVGHDPELWRYESLPDALRQGLNPLAALIRQRMDLEVHEPLPEVDDSSAVPLAAR